jgi:TolA-binding protein
MKRRSRVSAVVMGLCLLAGAASAQEEEKPRDFWGALRAKIEALVPTRPQAETTAVGGVRGAKSGDAEGLYWKGEAPPPAGVSEPEALAFRRAVELVVKGTREEGLTQFEQFLVAYPQSELRSDALRAIEEIKAGR